MRVLAIDTALEACSVAVLDTDRPDLRAHESLPMQRGHAEALMPLVARVLDRVQFDFSAIDRVAVTTGPGSFTVCESASRPRAALRLLRASPQSD